MVKKHLFEMQKRKKREAYKTILGLTRICLGFIFLWAFMDKTWGLGFSTTPEKAWLLGNSPTLGFLSGAAGTFHTFFNSLAGSPLVDWLFMMGLLLIGLSLMVGIGVKVAGYSGALMMLLMWLAVIPPKTNPILDDHIIYLLVLIMFTVTKAGHYLGYGEWWSKTSLVKKNLWLE